MTKQDLLTRISKKEEQIAKIEKRIVKWSKQCTDEEVKIAEDFRDNYSKFASYCRDNGLGYSFTPMAELRTAYSDLDDAKVTLNKYKNQLELIIEKENTEKFPILVEFFKGYRKRFISYIESNSEDLEEYYRLSHKSCDFFNNRHRLMNEMSKEEWDTEYKKLRTLEKEAYEKVHPITRDVYWKGTIDYDKLNEIIDKDIEAKYWNLIEKVTKYTGEIVDMSGVSIAGDGNLNGIVIGKDGNAKLETILAGGYNQNVIVNSRHGQILHYRLLVNKVK